MTKVTPSKDPVDRRYGDDLIEASALEQFLTVDQTADVLQVSPRHVRRLIARGALVAHRFGRLVRIGPVDLKAYTDAHRQ